MQNCEFTGGNKISVNVIALSESLKFNNISKLKVIKIDFTNSTNNLSKKLTGKESSKRYGCKIYSHSHCPGYERQKTAPN